MKLNVTARAARWSAAHWKTAMLLWLAFVVAAVGLGLVAGKQSLTDTENATGETARAEAMLAHAGFDRPSGESVLVQSRSGAGSTPALAREVRTGVRRLRTLPQVQNVHRARTSADGR